MIAVRASGLSNNVCNVCVCVRYSVLCIMRTFRSRIIWHRQRHRRVINGAIRANGPPEPSTGGGTRCVRRVQCQHAARSCIPAGGAPLPSSRLIGRARIVSVLWRRHAAQPSAANQSSGLGCHQTNGRTNPAAERGAGEHEIESDHVVRCG